MKRVFILFIFLFIVIVLFFIFNDDSEIENLGNLNADKVEECAEQLKENYSGTEISNKVIIVSFKEMMPEGEIRDLSVEYKMESRYIYKIIPAATFVISNESDIFEQICILMGDERIEYAEPDTFVYAQN